MNLKAMKLLHFSLLFLPFSLYAQNDEIEIKSDVKEVILYQTGVQETRQARLNVPEGNHILKFVGLPNAVNPNSIQVKGVNEFTILSINYRQNYVIEESKDPKLVMLSDSLETLTSQVDFSQKMIYVLNEEKAMLRANRKLVNNNGLVVEDMTEIAEFTSDRIQAIDVKLIGMQKELTQLNQKIQAINNQLQLERNGRNRATGEILVNVHSKNKLNGIVQLSYLTNNAGWRPFYDVRANEVGGPVEVSYKAHVYQKSGTDWENVRLILSTAQPNYNNSKPYIPIWYVNFVQPYTTRGDYAISGALSNTIDYKLDESKGTGSGPGTYSWNTPVNAVNQNAVNTEFVISSPYSIPSDGVEYVVEIGAYEFKSHYSYSAVPKMAEDAFLLAGITGWYGNSFLPAPSNIYYKGTFVGKSFLNTNTTKDTLDISMGVDESVIIKRKNISDVSSKTVTGNSKKLEEKFEITIRNTKSVEIEIDIEDHIPVSKQKEIVIEVNDLGGAELNKDSGRLNWKIKLAPNTSQTITFGYTVKYPKNFVIDNL